MIGRWIRIMTRARYVEGGIDSLVYKTFFPKSMSGVFVDVGAGDTVYLSISRFFERKGWRVIIIEPNPVFAAAHRKLGHEVYEFACADFEADGNSFDLVSSNGVLDEGRITYEAGSALKLRGELPPGMTKSLIKVNVRKLDTILLQYAKLSRIDILSVDVEWWELEVLKGIDLNLFRPRVVILENIKKSTLHRQTMNHHGYDLWRRSDPNDIYIRRWHTEYSTFKAK